MSSVQPLPLHAVAANDSAHSDDDGLDSPSGFHVVLGDDGSVVIERSHDELPAADATIASSASEAASQAAEEAEETAVPALRLAPRTPIAPARQLSWSFAGGALVATLLLVGAHQLYSRWTETMPRPNLGPSAVAAQRAHSSGIVTGTGAPPVAVPAAVPAAEPEPPKPTVGAALAVAPSAPVIEAASAVKQRPPSVATTARERRPDAPPAAPAPVAGPCTPAVAALGLCTLNQQGGEHP